jgi:hypothetical protein
VCNQDFGTDYRQNFLEYLPARGFAALVFHLSQVAAHGRGVANDIGFYDIG